MTNDAASTTTALISATVLMGLLYHSIGGLASASFYVPLRFVKKWRWENFWITMGLFAWILAPLLLATLTIPTFWDAITEVFSKNPNIIYWTFFFGMMWGFGNILYGMTMRYLGIGLGIAVALGSCAIFGTLIPPISNSILQFCQEAKILTDFLPAADGQSIGEIASTKSGVIVLIGIFLCALGIGVNGLAGMIKEKECDTKLPEQNVKLGIIVALFCGLLSACFAFGVESGKPIAALAFEKATAGKNLTAEAIEMFNNFQNNATYIIVLWGGFTTNIFICLITMFKNKSFGDFIAASPKISIYNLLLCALGGFSWYFQFFFYGAGHVKLVSEKLGFASWSLHMSSIIIFGAIWGLILKEWFGASKKVMRVLWLGVLILIASMFVIGLGGN